MEPSQIHCQVCSRLATAQLHFLCPTCARSRVYEPRLHHAQVLLDKDHLAREVQGFFTSDSEQKSERKSEPSTRSLKGSQQDLQHAQIQRARAAVAASTHASAEIKDEIQRLRHEIAARRTRLTQREQALDRKKETVSARGLRAFDPLPGIVRKVETDWVRLYTAISEDRLLLCTEVANLYGLDLRRRVRDSKTKDVYYLGDVPIVDLRELNNAAPTLVTVSLGRIAHLLHLTSHYLALQLPAEITLPSASNPHTLIHTPLSSYKEPSLPTGQKNANTLPKAARQRMLFLDKPLPTLAAEDQVAYSFFVDAVTLLAWNIAWLAKTQGIDIGAKHWDEVCAMGRNLWLLFGPQTRMAGYGAGSPPPPMHRRASSDRTTATMAAAARGVSPMARTPSHDAARRTNTPKGPNAPSGPSPATAAAAVAAVPGRLSHNSAFAFLPASSAQGGLGETLRAWPLANPIRLIERIKAALANERMGAEWEVLEKEAWAGHEEEGEPVSSRGPATSASTPVSTASAAAASAASAAVDAMSGAARMRDLLLRARAPSSESTATRTSAASAAGRAGTGAEQQRGGWLRVRGAPQPAKGAGDDLT